MNLRHPQLQVYLCDYTDGRMTDEVRTIFESYLRLHPDVAEYARKAIQGRQILEKFSNVPAGSTPRARQ